jgi:hypothetical protein
VKEEIDAAFIKRVNHGSKLIPVVIDDCEVPEVLKSTVWETIKDLSSYQESLERILEGIFGHASKPPIGPAPAYASLPLVPIAGISRTDTLVLKASCEQVIDANLDLIDPSSFPEGSILREIPKGVLGESLEILEHNYYVSQIKHIGADLAPYRITDYGFEEYCQTFFPGYRELFLKACFELVNNRPPTNQDLQGRLGIPLAVVDHILGKLKDAGHILMSNEISDRRHIVDVRVTLKRALEQDELA